MMEKIKYHEWGKNPDEYAYNPNTRLRELTDNWNPDADYGNEYVNVYFNIDTIGFDCVHGSFENEQDRKQWRDEADKIIAEFGYINGTEYDTRQTENKAHLYPHPQQFSGEIPKNDVKRVAERIAQSGIFKIRWIDIHDTVYIISDDEYEEYLNEKDTQIQETVFKVCVTTRTSMFYYLNDITHSVANKIRLRRLGLDDGRHGGSGQTSDHIEKVINKMIERGLLISKERYGNKYIRSLNKTEQRKKFKKLIYAD